MTSKILVVLGDRTFLSLLELLKDPPLVRLFVFDETTVKMFWGRSVLTGFWMPKDVYDFEAESILTPLSVKEFSFYCKSSALSDSTEKFFFNPTVCGEKLTFLSV